MNKMETLIKCEKCFSDRLDYEIKNVNECLYCYEKNKKFSKTQMNSMINFYKKINELGGKVIGEYVNKETRVRCKCKNDHDCNPRPGSIQQGGGICIICTGHDSETAKQNFYKKIIELGGEVIGAYINSNTPVKCKCKNGHDCDPRPGKIQQGRGMCKICACRDSETAKQNFYKRINELGGKVIGEYIDSNTPVECKCKNGHDCNPCPRSIQQRNGMCKICAGNDPETAKQNFYNNIKELGGEVIGEYINSNTPVECKCKNGHDCNPLPANIQKGRGMCIICAGLDPETAKQNFYNNIKELGGEVIGEYIHSNTPVKCKCKNEHDCDPRPAYIQQGGGMCKICSGNDSETSKLNFHDKIEELGGKVIGEYINNKISVECKCKNGHDCNPRPDSIQQGRGMCKICVGNDSETAKQNFYKRINELEGKVIGEYINNNTPVGCKCKNDHDCDVLPGNIQRGQGMCKICVGNDSETAKQNFYYNIEKLGGEVNGEYRGAFNPVHCKCKNGHDCYPSPTSVQQGNGMCIRCITVGYSKIAIKWIESISKNIQHAENIGEYYIQGTKYKVDGYDEKMNTIYEFHGCFWHGCVKCYTDREKMNPISKKTFEELYKKTIERIALFKSLGYNVVEKWECEM